MKPKLPATQAWATVRVQQIVKLFLQSETAHNDPNYKNAEGRPPSFFVNSPAGDFHDGLHFQTGGNTVANRVRIRLENRVLPRHVRLGNPLSGRRSA
jgi:hypothetical protein